MQVLPPPVKAPIQMSSELCTRFSGDRIGKSEGRTGTGREARESGYGYTMRLGEYTKVGRIH